MSLRQPGATIEAINHSSKGTLTAMNRNDKTTLIRLENGRPSFFCAGMVPVTANFFVEITDLQYHGVYSMVPVESLGR